MESRVVKCLRKPNLSSKHLTFHASWQCQSSPQIPNAHDDYLLIFGFGLGLGTLNRFLIKHLCYDINTSLYLCVCVCVLSVGVLTFRFDCYLPPDCILLALQF